MNGFLARWSRRKAEASVAPVDEATLPKLETLTSASDFAPFLAAGVSQALQSQALRIAWQSDARIAGFRGMADYDWDFNEAGYGRLALADDVAALLRRVITPDAPTPQPVQLAAPPPEPPLPAPPTVVVADETPPRPAPRRHGGALPA
jgi:hypothetical protein